MKKMLFAAAAVLCGSLFAAPAPVLEFKLDDPDLAKAVNTGSQQPGMKLKAYMTEYFGAGEGRKGNKVLAFNNLTEKQLTKKIAGLEIPQTAYKMDFSKPFSFMAFVKINDKLNNKGPQYTIACTATSDVGPGWRLFYSWYSFRFFSGVGKNKPKDLITDISVNYQKTKLDAAKWNHLAVVYNGTTVALYLNGKLETEKPMQVVNNRGPLNIGCYNNGYAYGMAGMINDVKFYDKALTAEEVAAEAAK